MYLPKRGRLKTVFEAAFFLVKNPLTCFTIIVELKKSGILFSHNKAKEKTVSGFFNSSNLLIKNQL